MVMKPARQRAPRSSTTTRSRPTASVRHLQQLWDNGGDAFFGFRMILSAKIFDRAMSQEMGDHSSLTLPQLRVVTQLGLFGVGSVRSLAEGAAVDRAEVSRATRELLKSKLIQQLPNASDPRSSLFALTPRGRREYQRGREPARALLKVLLKGLPNRDLAAANRVFWHITQASLKRRTGPKQKAR